MARYRKNYQEDEELETNPENPTNDEKGGDPESIAANAEGEAPKSAKEATFEKRYGDLRRYADKEINSLKAEVEKLKNSSANAPKLPQTEEEFEAWKEKYPVVAGMIETAIIKNSANIPPEIASRLARVDELEQTLAEAATERAKERALKVIRDSHPDWDTIVADDKFHEWAATKSKWVQDGLYENETNPEWAIEVVDLYKADKNKKVSGLADSKRAAAPIGKSQTPSVNNKGGNTFYESQVEKMSTAEYEKYSDQIDEARASGNFVYDLSAAS